MATAEELIERVASNVRQFRDLKGLTIEEVAKQGNLPLRTLLKIEAGGCNLQLDTMAKLCLGLEVDMQELLQLPLKPEKKS